jgi:hypothetical protein
MPEREHGGFGRGSDGAGYTFAHRIGRSRRSLPTVPDLRPAVVPPPSDASPYSCRDGTERVGAGYCSPPHSQKEIQEHREKGSVERDITLPKPAARTRAALRPRIRSGAGSPLKGEVTGGRDLRLRFNCADPGEATPWGGARNQPWPAYCRQADSCNGRAGSPRPMPSSLVRLRRSALTATRAELPDIARAAISGLSRKG